MSAGGDMGAGENEDRGDAGSGGSRPASMHERKSKLPLHVQMMMACGPMNNREVAYFPWTEEKKRTKSSKHSGAKQETPAGVDHGGKQEIEDKPEMGVAKI
ncbi:hypothetical protein Q1695_002247 [Nippostrongylus brasiliensis]|nr:hypothetical protein Q1695_002247 [Nippostrongylus brasiliensis]